MDAIVLLKDDHRTVEKLFKEFEQARDRAYKTKRKIADKVIEEHHVVLWMLSELAGPDPEDERFDAKMTVLMENVRHHVEEEEKEWFPQVRSVLGRNRLGELGEQLAAGKPDAPHDPLRVPSAQE